MSKDPENSRRSGSPSRPAPSKRIRGISRAGVDGCSQSNGAMRTEANPARSSRRRTPDPSKGGARVGEGFGEASGAAADLEGADSGREAGRRGDEPATPLGADPTRRRIPAPDLLGIPRRQPAAMFDLPLRHRADHDRSSQTD